MQRHTTLAFRRSGQKDWVEVDPSTPSGQRLLAALGISHPTEEAMTATTAAAANAAAGVGSRERLTIVPGDNVQNMGALLRARRRLSGWGVKIRGTASGAWNWVVKTLHLDTVVGYVKTGARWLWSKVTGATRFLGTSGMVGTGLVAVSTTPGRRLLGMALKPVGWALGLVGRLYVGVENMLFSEDREGGIRNTISLRMADARIAVFGDGTSAGKPGYVPTAAFWTLSKVGPHLSLDSWTMRIARAVGIGLVLPKVAAAITFLPFGAFTLPVQILVGGMLGFAAVAPFNEDVRSIGRRVVNSVRSDAKAADVIVGRTEDRIAAEAHEVARTTIATPARPVNREQRRAAARKPASATR